ncbi:TPA: ABC transporter ATP-binding protein [Enterobacter cloacae]|nr:ABC transporter ATP-binding protein [Enterobacter pasteurii]
MNISVSGLSVTRQALTVLENINLDLPSGQIVGLLGPNGSGKSTLLRCLAGLFPHLGERVALNGTSLSVMPLKTRARHLAFVPQHADVEGELTVEDIVRLGRTPYRKAFQRNTRDDDAAVEEAISLMQLGGLRQRRWQHLSGGERQRSQIARALAQRPRVLLLDEPTNHLDIQHQLELMRLISRLPLTVVVALHDLNLAANYCQRLILLKAGRVSATGAPPEVLTAENIEKTWCVKANVYRADAGITIGYSMGGRA